MFIFRRLLFLVFVVVSALPIAKADELSDLEDALTGLWLVTAGEESKAHTLKIHSVEERSRGVFLLDADYGWYTGEKAPISAELRYASKVLSLSFSTPEGGKIVATEETDGKFSGTLVRKNGSTKRVILAKVPPDKVASVQQAELNAVPDIQQPSADVPASCAAFIGGWTGISSNVGRFWLWIVEIDRNCVAKYAYGASAAVPMEFKMAEIRSGVLTIPRRIGHSTFEVRGNELARRNYGTGGSGNPVAMHKINTSDGSIAILRAEQTADRPRDIPPSPNVPLACASFFGSWVGTWTRGREHLLHVSGVDAKCTARYSYSLTSDSASRIFYNAEIKDGVLLFRCNQYRSTMCSFRRVGNELEGVIGSSRRQPNTGVFRKVE